MDSIILELIEVKVKKSLFAINQQYENAAKCRDIEIVLENKIYNMINTDLTNTINNVSIKETIGNYIKQKYGYDYPNYWQDLESGIMLIRDLKLRIL